MFFRLTARSGGEAEHDPEGDFDLLEIAATQRALQSAKPRLVDGTKLFEKYSSPPALYLDLGTKQARRSRRRRRRDDNRRQGGKLVGLKHNGKAHHSLRVAA